MSALCQSRPMHRSKQHLYSITSSARVSSVDGMVNAERLGGLEKYRRKCCSATIGCASVNLNCERVSFFMASI